MTSEDIRLSVTFFQHRKTKKLELKRGADGVLALLSLWTRVAVEKPCGTLTGWDSTDIALEANYKGDADKFVECLIAVGFLDLKDGTYSLHNWGLRQNWVAKTEERADKARFSVLARILPDIHTKMKADGITAIDRATYNSITVPNRLDIDRLSIDDRTDIAQLSPEPEPSPSPYPSPLPDPISLPTFTTNNVSSTTHAREGDICLCKQGVVLDGVCEYCGLQQ